MGEEPDLICCEQCGCPYFAMYGEKDEAESVTVKKVECTNCGAVTEREAVKH